jgi:hypothetical protein
MSILQAVSFEASTVNPVMNVQWGSQDMRLLLIRTGFVGQYYGCLMIDYFVSCNDFHALVQRARKHPVGRAAVWAPV